MVKLLLDKGAKLEEDIMFETKFFQIIKYLLKRGANPKATDSNGNTLLHKLCQSRNVKNVKYLIQHYNADMNANNRKGQTSLHSACECCYLEMVKFLIEEQKADPAVSWNEGKTALHCAATHEVPIVLRYLIEDQKIDINASDNKGRTTLHKACQSKIFSGQNWATQKYLIKEHPQIIAAKDKKGKTALHYCLKKFDNKTLKYTKPFRPTALILAATAEILKTRGTQGTDHICDWIKQGYENSKTKDDKKTKKVFDWIKQNYKSMKKSKKEDEAVLCIIAGLKSFNKELSKIVEKGIDFNPLLYIAMYCNRMDIAEFMFNQDICYIERHFNAKEVNSKKNFLLKTYLKFSCKNGFLDLASFLFQERSNRQESFKGFIFDGSFLKKACWKKHFDIFKYLLEDEKAKDEAAEFLKDFPLHCACGRGSLEMVQYLIETKKIEIELRDKEGSTPLHCACFAGQIDIAKYLIETQNANINATGNKGKSVWHYASQSGCLKLVKFISKKTKPDVNAQDEVGLTALHLACQFHSFKKTDLISNFKVVKFLISDMKANVDSLDIDGRTPLHVLCQTCSIVLVLKFFVNQGANVLGKDKSGKTPLQIAEDKTIYHKEKIAFLKVATKR
jgi:ankyrin repeat protein